MLSLPPNARFLLAEQPVNMTLSFNGLIGLVPKDKPKEESESIETPTEETSGATKSPETPENPVPDKSATRNQGCWPHARRHFVKAGKANYSESVFVLEMIGELYEVEDRARKLTAGEWFVLRQKESIAILDRIFIWCREHGEKCLTKEAMRTAIDYLLRNESALRVYCTDGRLEIDNNACEECYGNGRWGERIGCSSATNVAERR